MSLSERSKVLWAKASRAGCESWTPLFVHMSDSAHVCSRIWDTWVAASIKSRIAQGITAEGTYAEPKAVAMFLSSVHDLGKAIPSFQSRALPNNPLLQDRFRNELKRTDLPFRLDLNDQNAIKHATASQIILEEHGIHRSLAVVPGGHHGLTPSRKELRLLKDAYPDHIGIRMKAWHDVHIELISFCCKTAGMSLDAVKRIRLDVESQILLSGIVVMCDWLASNECLFPLLHDTPDEVLLGERGKVCSERMRTPSKWLTAPAEDHIQMYRDRFAFEPRPFQLKVAEIASEMQRPGIMVIEAPMGEGKTEAALVAAEVLIRKFGFDGIMFGLPTQATADGVFPRIRSWSDAVTEGAEGFHTIFLAHGRSAYNEDFNSLKHVDLTGSESEHGQVIHEWFTGKRKGILSDFVIGTVDQILMMGLKQKHSEMRHLGICGKVVIIDECHAYDAYMGSYLSRTLEWLGSYGIPTIMLSATLPPKRRRDYVSAYMGKKGAAAIPCCEGYPRITYTDGDDVRSFSARSSNRCFDVRIERISDSELLEEVMEYSRGGGYVGIVVNTVKRAQTIADGLRNSMSDTDIVLLHSGFTGIDRSLRESRVLRSLRSENRKEPPYRMIVVGTQVMEQSLDLDFDILFTDLCPMDLLLQRIGRLHRHDNVRPEHLRDPICKVVYEDEGFDSGSESVYGRYQLYNARTLLGDVISIPSSIPQLVEQAYSDEGVSIEPQFRDDYSKSKQLQTDLEKNKENKAKAFQIGRPSGMDDLTGWLNNSILDDTNGDKAIACVRDGDRSVEAILIQRINGILRVLPWIPDYGGCEIGTDDLSEELAFTVSGCKVPLPRAITARDPNRVIDWIRDLDSVEIPASWSDSEWLNGDLFLILDENLCAKVCDRTIRYDDEKGMTIVD